MNSKLLPLVAGLMAGLNLTPFDARAQVTFWYKGVIQEMDIEVNSVPAGIQEGTPFTGYVAYDSAGWGSTNLMSYPSGQVGDYYYYDAAKMKMVLQMGGHTFVSTNHPGGRVCGSVQVQDQIDDPDRLELATGEAVILMDGATWPPASDLANWTIRFSDSTKTVYSSVDIPTTPPSLAQFPDVPRFWFSARTSDGETLFSLLGEITGVTSAELVQLNFRRVTPSQIILAWPRVANGFTLQSRTDLTAGNWQNVFVPVVDDATDHTVTVAVDGGSRYFRLKK